MLIEDIIPEGTRCWKGYEKKGMKTMFGKRVPNCVKKEDVGGKYSKWDHEESAEYSKHLEETFGPPDEMTDEQTVWHNADGFKRIVCRDEYILHGSPAPHYDFIYCYIDLEVPEDLSDELAKCSGSILIDHLKNEVGARCGSLTANATTLNFVLDVVAGRAEPVKEEYEKRILAMKDMFEKGERYELDWWPDESGDADPDNPYYAEGLGEEIIETDNTKMYDPKTGRWQNIGPGALDRSSPEAEKAKKDAEKILPYRIGRGISRLLKRDPDYDPYDQRDKEVKSFRPAPKSTQSSIYEPVGLEKIRAQIGARYGLTAKDVLKYSVADEPLDNLKQFSPDKYNAVQAFRKDYPPVFNSYGEPVNEDLRAWFGKGKKGGAGGGGWDRYNTKGERIGKCGDSKKGEGKPKCLSKSRAASLRAKGGKKAIAAAVRKKRREDPNKNRRGKAKNVSNTTRKS